MGKDSKIAAVAFLIFALYGMFNLIEGELSYVLPYPLIAVIIPIVCIVYFFFKIHWQAFFFLFFPMNVVQFVLEPFVTADLEWISIFGGLAAILVWISFATSVKSNLKMKWLVIISAACFSMAHVVYTLQVEYLIYIMPLVGLMAIPTLLINKQYFEENQILKRQFLIYALTSGLFTPLLAMARFS